MEQPNDNANAAASPPLPVAAETNAVPVISPRFRSPHPVQIAIVGTHSAITNITDVDFEVTDADGNLMFKVKSPIFLSHNKKTLVDASGVPVATLRPKPMSLHGKWHVFRGDSKESSDLLYTIELSSLRPHIKTELDVFLANNREEKRCDFRIKGSSTQCDVFAGESDTIVAQMHHKHKVKSIFLGSDTLKDNLLVTVYPNVDYAFIVSLIVIYNSYYKD